MSTLGIQKSFDLGDGRIITLETGKLAKQADGSAVIKMGDTMLLATIVTKKEAAENVDFLPLSVEYQEKYAAAGRFPGGFFKREARLSEYEILISRLVDRALRPLFPDDYHAETQVQITLISAGKDIMPDALACLAASTAITVCDIPFHGPISEVRVARIDGKLKVNPTFTEVANADIDIMVAASMDNIVMVEGEMKEVSETDLAEALKFAHSAIKIQCQAQIEFAAMVEKANPKREYCHENNDEDLRKAVKDATYAKAYACAKSGNKNKHERGEAFEAILNEFIESIPEEEREAKTPLIKKYYHDVEKKAMRDMILIDRFRLDGRKLDEIRPIWC